MKFQKIIPIFLCFTNCVSLQCMEKERNQRDEKSILTIVMSHLRNYGLKIFDTTDDLHKFLEIYCVRYPTNLSICDDLWIDKFEGRLLEFFKKYNKNNIKELEIKWRKFLMYSDNYRSVSLERTSSYRKNYLKKS